MSLSKEQPAGGGEGRGLIHGFSVVALISDRLWEALTTVGVEEASDLAYLFVSEDEAPEWAVLQQCSEDSDSFVAAWAIVRRLVDEDRSVVDRILATELARRRAVPKARPVRPHAQPHRRRAAITDSVSGLEGVRVSEYSASSLAGAFIRRSLVRGKPLGTIW